MTPNDLTRLDAQLHHGRPPFSIHFRPPFAPVALLARYWSRHVCIRAFPADAPEYLGDTQNGRRITTSPASIQQGPTPRPRASPPRLQGPCGRRRRCWVRTSLCWENFCTARALRRSRAEVMARCRSPCGRTVSKQTSGPVLIRISSEERFAEAIVRCNLG